MIVSLLLILLFSIPAVPLTLIGAPSRPPSCLPLMMSNLDDFPSDTTPAFDPGTSARDALLTACKEAAGEVDSGQLSRLVSSLPSSPLSTPPTSKWSLLHTTTDRTRSSPFFASFTSAIGEEKSKQIYSITDSIPSPLKSVGEATQTFEEDESLASRGTLVSRVVISALGGLSSSVMTSRCSYSAEGSDLQIKVLTTKPEESTIVSLLPDPLKSAAESFPAFPSGEALRMANGGADVEITSEEVYVDDFCRVNRMGGEMFVWERVYS